MKPKESIIETILLLGILIGMPSSVFSKTRQDSLVLDKVFAYRDNYARSVKGDTTNGYIKYSFDVVRRNPTLMFIPTMYHIARGRHRYIGETYGRLVFHDVDRFDLHEQVYFKTIPHNRRAMNTMAQYLTPDIYSETIFKDNIISPFNRSNRIFYRYRTTPNGDDETCLHFTPRLKNTQLIAGFAIVDNATGRILRSTFRGNHDMLDFGVDVDMGEERDSSPLPVSCESTARFRFVGNNIRTSFKAYFDCPTTLPDSIREKKDTTLLSTLRPDSLTPTERAIYSEYYADVNSRRDTTVVVEKKGDNRLKRMVLGIGDHLLSSLDASSSRAYVSLSPIINPLSLSYSHSRGVSYKMNLGARYNFTPNRSVSFYPKFGYNFKIKQFFFNSPLRFTYDDRHDGWVELLWANGNRITNSSVLDAIRGERRDTVDFSALNLDYFNDGMWKLAWNTHIGHYMELRLGTVYHHREAVNREALQELGKPIEYKSFAPFVTLTICPSSTWPVLTLNYERSMKSVLRSNTEYERFECDASLKMKLSRMRRYNLRFGGGFYTNKESDYFVDFDNFHENYVPGGWDDDWSGDFQLLNSQWYNASRYYLRANASYEQPLLALSWLPLLGQFIETERLYASALQIEHTRPYYELGYGFTSRFISVGIFCSLLNGEIHQFGTRFSFELFRKW